jgi:hypothetical protein
MGVAVERQKTEYYGWKEIAWRVGVSLNTAIRRHKEEGLPVRRDERGNRYMIEDEYQEWLRRKETHW